MKTHLTAFLLVALASCGGAAVGEVTTTGARMPSHDASDLLVSTASCWLGGMWGDVQGDTPGEREDSTNARCENAAAIGLGSRALSLQLRAHETTAVVGMREAIEKRADAAGMDSARKNALLRVYDSVEGAEHEVMNARRSAHRILRDEPRGIETLAATETSELPTLEASQAYDDLARVDAGPFAVQAHTFLLWVTLDRLRIAEELPVHLKPYPIDEPLRVVFSAPSILLPHDASKPLERGAYLVYLSDAARAARHPALDTQSLLVQHEDAMSGIFEGVADQLRADCERLPEDSELRRISTLLVRALDQSRARVAMAR
jgi:hypothetical protein